MAVSYNELVLSIVSKWSKAAHTDSGRCTGLSESELTPQGWQREPRGGKSSIAKHLFTVPPSGGTGRAKKEMTNSYCEWQMLFSNTHTGPSRSLNGFGCTITVRVTELKAPFFTCFLWAGTYQQQPFCWKAGLDRQDTKKWGGNTAIDRDKSSSQLKWIQITGTEQNISPWISSPSQTHCLSGYSFSWNLVKYQVKSSYESSPINVKLREIKSFLLIQM